MVKVYGCTVWLYVILSIRVKCIANCFIRDHSFVIDCHCLLDFLLGNLLTKLFYESMCKV